MKNSRSARNWPGILDSGREMPKYFHPTAKAASEILDWPLNSDWKLAKDPSRLSNAPSKKTSSVLPKRVERKIWARPALVELTKTAVRSERAKASAIRYREKLQTKKVVQPAKAVLAEKLPGPRRPPLWQPKTTQMPVRRKPHTVRRCLKAGPTKRAVQAPAIKQQKPSKSKVPEKKTTTTTRTTTPPVGTTKSLAARRWRSAAGLNRIVVVDAKTQPWLQRPMTVAAAQPMASPMASSPGRTPRGCMSGRSKKSYGVPLCSRPTRILGMGLPFSRHMQMRQAQLYQQPEYHDQYMRMLQQQQRQSGGQMDEQQFQQQFQQQPVQQPAQPQMFVNSPYAVPAEVPLKGLKAGKRLCGNFYYDAK